MTICVNLLALSRRVKKERERGDKSKETILFCLCWRQFWDLEQDVHWFWAPSLPQNWEMSGTISLHFKEMAPRFLRNTLLGHQSDERPARKNFWIFRINYIHFKEIRKCLQFSKENSGREGTEERSLPYFQQRGLIKPLFSICVLPYSYEIKYRKSK